MKTSATCRRRRVRWKRFRESIPCEQAGRLHPEGQLRPGCVQDHTTPARRQVTRRGQTPSLRTDVPVRSSDSVLCQLLSRVGWDARQRSPRSQTPCPCRHSQHTRGGLYALPRNAADLNATCYEHSKTGKKGYPIGSTGFAATSLGTRPAQTASLLFRIGCLLYASLQGVHERRSWTPAPDRSADKCKSKRRRTIGFVPESPDTHCSSLAMSSVFPGTATSGESSCSEGWVPWSGRNGS